MTAAYDIAVAEERPDSPDASTLINELDAYLGSLGYPKESQHGYSINKLVREGVAFFVIRRDQQAVGCGGLRLLGDEYGEVKRMYVRPEYRGLGLGKAMLDRLALYGQEHGVIMLRLETGIYQTEAIALYERCEFYGRGPFGEYIDDPMSIYFEKIL